MGLQQEGSLSPTQHALLQDETASTGQSLPGDDDQEGALSNFLPTVMPARPSELELKDSGVQVAQV